MRCPICHSVYPVSEGFCPMDGAVLVAEQAVVPPLVARSVPTAKGGVPKPTKSGARSLAKMPGSSVAAPRMAGHIGGQKPVQQQGHKATIVGAFFPKGGLSIPRSQLEQRPRVPPEEDLIGKVFDQRYEILSEIGSGGMAVVFRGRHVIIDKRVAIKVLRSEHMRNADVAQRFLQEAQLASRIKHPNVVEVSDYGQLAANRLCYYVMEYLDGQSLADRIDLGEPIGPAEAIELAQQILAGLQVAHDAGVIHRDLKPDNIFLTTDPQTGGTLAKILDFGIARALDRKTRLTAAGTVIGTPEYMSPEQAQGHEIDGRSDLYALGVIVFEMLTGKVPFDANTTLAALTQHVYDPPPALHEVCPELPPLEHIGAVLERLMAKSREDRPESCEHASELLLAALERDRRAIERGPTPVPVSARPKRTTMEIGSNSVVVKVDDDDVDDLPDFDAPHDDVRHPGDPVSMVRGDTGQVQPRDFGVSERYRRKKPSVIVSRDEGVERFEKPKPMPKMQVAPPVVVPEPEPEPANGRGWIVVLSLVAAVVGAAVTVYLFQQFRNQPAQPAPAPVGQAVPVVAEPPATSAPLHPPRVAATPEVTLTFASMPSGALVKGPEGSLGHTPLSLRVLPTKSPRAFTFELPEHRPETRKFVPDTDSEITVVLQPTGKKQRRKARPTSPKQPPAAAPKVPQKSQKPAGDLALSDLKDPFAGDE